MCCKLSIKASAPALPPTPRSRTILILGPPNSGLTAFYDHITNSPSKPHLNINGVSHPLAFFDGTPLHAYDSSLAKDHLQCFTGAIVLYSPSDAGGLEHAKGIVDELQRYEIPGLMKGGIVVVCTEKGRELGVVEGADAHRECNTETWEGCVEAIGELVRVIEDRWEEWVWQREKERAKMEWEVEVRRREGRVGWRRVLCW